MSAFGEYRKHIIKTSVKFDENKGHQGQGHQYIFLKNVNCRVFNKAKSEIQGSPWIANKYKLCFKVVRSPR